MRDGIDHRPAGLWLVAAVVLAVLVIGAGWPLVLRVTAMVQFDYNEGWNAYREQAAAQLVPLYRAEPGLEITNYPPLSFHIVGLLSRLTGNVTITGRVLSLLSLAVVCLAIGLITQQFATGYAGACAALLFALWPEIWMPNRIGVNDPQLLGMTFEVTGFYAFVRRAGSGWSAVLFALAVFTKQNLIALPIGAGASLLISREWRLLFRWVAAGVLAVAVLYVAAEIADGPYLLADIMHKRAYRLADAFSQSGLYLLVFLPFFGISAAWVYRNHGCARRRPLVIGWLVAHAAGLVFSGGDGTGRNIFFEAIVLDAIIVVIAYHDLFSRKGVPVMSAALLLAAPMLFPLFLLPGEVSGSLREWQRLPVMQDDFAEGVGLLRGSSSPVLCENLLMCYQAGKQSAFDLYFVQDQIKTGRISEDGIVDLVASRRLAMVEIGDVDGPEPAARSRARFTGRFMQTLLKQYRVVLRTPEFTVLVPGDGPPLSPAVSISKKVVDAGLRRHDGL